MKKITFRQGNISHEVDVDSAISREELYGKVSRAVQSPDGQPLQKGLLTQEGVLLPVSAVMNCKVDPKGSLVQASLFKREGLTLTPTPSSFKDAREITPGSIEDLATLAVDAVYPIIPPASLIPGVYHTTFNYRDSVDPSDATLLVRPAGNPSFLLVGEKKEFAPTDQTTLYNLFTEEVGEEDEDGDGGFSFENVG